MKYAILFTMMLAVFLCALDVSAETFALNDGTEVEGTIVRTVGSKVTIKTQVGVSTYDVMEFGEKTRTEHFEELETAVVRRKMAAAERAEAKVKPASMVMPKDVVKSLPKGALWLMIVGLVFCVIGSLWFIIEGFSESVLWGIALILSNGIGGLAFLILHWNRAKSPVFIYLLGIAMVVAGALIGR